MVAFSILVGAAQSLAACSSDTSTTAAITPVGPPALALEEPVEGACVPLADGDSLTLRVRIAVTNWSLRPPGFCGIYPQCGYAVYFVDGQKIVESATLATDVPMGSLADPTGQHTLRVELRDDNGVLALDADGAPLRVDRAVVTSSSDAGTCP